MITFYSYNLIDDAVLTPSTVNSQFPVSNLKESLRTKTFRSTTNSDSILINLGDSHSVDSFVITDNWLDGFGVSSLTLKANATPDMTSPAFSTAVTFDVENGFGYVEFANQNYQYWQLEATSTLGYCELSNFFLGQKIQPTTWGLSLGWSLQNDDQSKVQRSEYGQEFFDLINNRQKLRSFSLENLNKNELDEVLEIYEHNRRSRPFYLRIGDGTNTIINDEGKFNGIYKLNDTTSFTNKSFGLYSITFQLNEQL